MGRKSKASAAVGEAEVEVELSADGERAAMMREDHYVGTPCLSYGEMDAWSGLVLAGRDTHDERREEKIAAGNGSSWLTGKRKSKRSNSMPNPPVGVVRYVLLSLGGMTYHKAIEAAGITAFDFIDARNRCEEVRSAHDAMRAAQELIQSEKAMGQINESLDGVEVPAANLKLAMMIAERLRGGRYSDPKAVAIAQAGSAQKAVGGGGIAVVLIADAAKAAAEPLPAGGAAVLTDV